MEGRGGRIGPGRGLEMGKGVEEMLAGQDCERDVDEYQRVSTLSQVFIAYRKVKRCSY